MDEVLLEGPEQPLGDGVGPGFGHAGVARRESPEPDPVAKGIGHDGAARIMAACEAAGGAGGERAGLLPGRPARRPGCVDALAAPRHGPARKRGVPMRRDHKAQTD
jgi:hypothetical protein